MWSGIQVVKVFRGFVRSVRSQKTWDRCFCGFTWAKALCEVWECTSMQVFCKKRLTAKDVGSLLFAVPGGPKHYVKYGSARAFKNVVRSDQSPKVWDRCFSSFRWAKAFCGVEARMSI